MSNKMNIYYIQFVIIFVSMVWMAEAVRQSNPLAITGWLAVISQSFVIIQLKNKYSKFINK